MQPSARAAQRRLFTSWWHKYVYGRNPDDWPRADTAMFFEAQGIDPISVGKEVIEDYRRYYMTEMNYFAPEGSREDKRPGAFARLAQKRRVQLRELRESCPSKHNKKSC